MFIIRASEGGGLRGEWGIRERGSEWGGGLKGRGLIVGYGHRRGGVRLREGGSESGGGCRGRGGAEGDSRREPRTVRSTVRRPVRHPVRRVGSGEGRAWRKEGGQRGASGKELREGT